MASKEGQNQDEAVESGDPAVIPITALLQGFQERDKNPGQTSFKKTLSPVLIANLLLSAVLFVTICKIGFQGIKLREEVDQLTQENRQLAWKLESVREEVHTSSENLQDEPTTPSKTSSEKARELDSPAELQENLDAQRQEREQTVARLEQEEQKRKDLEREAVIDKRLSTRDETTEEAITRKPTLKGKAPESSATESQETITGKPVKGTVHVIRKGENLYRIGIKYAVPWETLVKYNNLTDAKAIYVGQRIRIPKSEE